MKMRKIKSTDKLPVGEVLIQADIIFDNTAHKRATLKFKGGQIIEVSAGSYDTLTILVTEEPEFKTIFVLDGKKDGADLRVKFDEFKEANDWGDRNCDSGFKITEFKVDVDKDIKQIKDEEIPF